MSASELAIGQGSFAVTPHDSTNFAKRARILYVGGAGDVALVNTDGSVTMFKSAPAGQYILTESIRVNAIGTTATFLVGIV